MAETTNFVTKEYLETQFRNFATRIAVIFAKGADVPTKVSDLTNDEGFVTSVVTNLVNYYTKDQTYTKEEIKALVANVGTMSLEVVDSLPIENISTNTIYLVEKETAGANNVYIEYVYINGEWEIIGETDINLSGYATLEQLSATLADYLKKTDVETENIDFSTYFVS